MHFATVANDESLPADVRLDAAKAAAQYLHARPKPVEMEPDALVELEGRVARARLEAQAEVLDANPSLSDRLARAMTRTAEDVALMAAARPVVLNVQPSSVESKQNNKHDAVSPLSASRREPEPEKPDERTQAPATSASADWVEKPAAAEPYRPLLAWPEPAPSVSVDYDPTHGSYDLERK
ncbi:hypothetical protein ACFFP0_14325 [Rhizobium puerariae]|uniref:Uncharacterized protein n=1 Tax=Rhizobium puerariae TaxID=1585791 RepID=A0ABV6AL16_9HYPH